MARSSWGAGVPTEVQIALTQMATDFGASFTSTNKPRPQDFGKGFLLIDGALFWSNGTSFISGGVGGFAPSYLNETVLPTDGVRIGMQTHCENWLPGVMHWFSGTTWTPVAGILRIDVASGAFGFSETSTTDDVIGWANGYLIPPGQVIELDTATDAKVRYMWSGADWVPFQQRWFFGADLNLTGVNQAVYSTTVSVPGVAVRNNSFVKAGFRLPAGGFAVNGEVSALNTVTLYISKWGGGNVAGLTTVSIFGEVDYVS